MVDPFMHARTMALLEFACPPLPIADGKRMETEDRAIINSHDLMSAFMAQAFKQSDDRLNQERKRRQTETEAAYYQKLQQSDGSFESIYAIMATYTQDYLGCFLLPPFTTKDVRVLPPDYISPALLNEIRDYCKALQIVYNAPGSDDEPHGHVHYVRECFRIICHKEQKKGV